MTDEAPPQAPSAEAPTGEAKPPAELGAPDAAEGAAKLDAVPAAEKAPEVVKAPAADQPADETKLTVPSGPVSPWRPNYVFLAAVSVVSLALDLGTKWWAEARLHTVRSWPEVRVEVIKDHVGFMFRKNDGGAWGLLSTEPASVRRPFFLGISVVAIIFIVSLYRKLTPRQWALKWGLPLVLGGALGNLVNRIQYNYVVDFIDVSAHWDGAEHHWPTFNVADIWIVVGVLLMAVDMFTPSPGKMPGTMFGRRSTVTPAAAPLPPVDGKVLSMGAPPPTPRADAPAEPAPKET